MAKLTRDPFLEKRLEKRASAQETRAKASAGPIRGMWVGTVVLASAILFQSNILALIGLSMIIISFFMHRRREKLKNLIFK